ncbi:hypothetical protein KKH18_11320, partial [bacterium]|nr:hypothetical protein [bacterium]
QSGMTAFQGINNLFRGIFGKNKIDYGPTSKQTITQNIPFVGDIAGAVTDAAQDISSSMLEPTTPTLYLPLFSHNILRFKRAR